MNEESEEALPAKNLQEGSTAESSNESGLHEHFQKVLLAVGNLSESDKKLVLEAVFSQKVSISQQSSFRGPIPSPETLREYSAIIPNGAERILAMAENQSQHRMQLENHVVHAQLSQSKRGQTFAFVLGLTGLLVATFLAYNGHETTACVLGGGSLVALASAFLGGKSTQKKEIEEKKK